MKFIKRLIITILLIAIIAVGTVVYMGYSMYKEAITKISIADRIEEIKKDIAEKNYASALELLLLVLC